MALGMKRVSYRALYIRRAFLAVVLRGIFVSSFIVCQRESVGVVRVVASFTVKR